MVTNTMQLTGSRHPNKPARQAYDQLIGLEAHKQALLSALQLYLDQDALSRWQQRHHGKHGLPVMKQLFESEPLFVLSGEVGCGKTVLARSIASPLGEALDKTIWLFETPSNIRGSGLVGEISNRITEVFDQVKSRTKEGEASILLIDEADDLATSREQNQAHHEDRAGLNVLIKQLDSLKSTDKKIAVIMITNRVSVLDPAVRRRASLELVFERPDGNALEQLWRHVLTGITYSLAQEKQLLAEAKKHPVLYSTSDIIHRVLKSAVIHALETDTALSVDHIIAAIRKVAPTPLLDKAVLNR